VKNFFVQKALFEPGARARSDGGGGGGGGGREKRMYAKQSRAVRNMSHAAKGLKIL
jgi:hypothetical protein